MSYDQKLKLRKYLIRFYYNYRCSYVLPINLDVVTNKSVPNLQYEEKRNWFLIQNQCITEYQYNAVKCSCIHSVFLTIYRCKLLLLFKNKMKLIQRSCAAKRT